MSQPLITQSYPLYAVVTPCDDTADFVGIVIAWEIVTNPNDEEHLWPIVIRAGAHYELDSDNQKITFDKHAAPACGTWSLHHDYESAAQALKDYENDGQQEAAHHGNKETVS